MSALTAASGEPQSVGDAGTLPPTEFLELIGATVDNVRSLALYDLLRTRLVRSVVVASPAAGADFTVTVPTNTAWQVQSITARLVTSAVVANRFPTLTVTDGAAVVARVGNIATQAAANTFIYSWLAGIGVSATNAASVAASTGFPSMWIPGGVVIASSTASIDVGDQWSQIALSVIEYSVGQVYWAADLLGRELGFEHLTDLPGDTPLPVGTGQAIPVSPLAR